MRRFLMPLALCVMLAGTSWLGAHAQIAIAGDAKGEELLMDVTLRDADLTEALTALFSTTNGKYQLNIGPGVVGRVARLQLTQTKFDNALDAILGPDFSYTKQQLGTGSFLYRISGRRAAETSPTAGRGGNNTTFGPPDSSLSSKDTTRTGGTTASSSTISSSSIFYNTSTAANTGTGIAGDGTLAGSAAAAESSYIRLILVANLDIEGLSDMLGGTSIRLFEQSTTGGTSGGRSSRSSRESNTGTRTTQPYNNYGTSGTERTLSRTNQTQNTIRR